MKRIAALLAALLPTTATLALPPEREQRLVDEARKILGVHYELGGRMKKAGEGIDCQGLVFFALQASTSTCGWKSYSVMPTESVAARELGAPVEGLAPVATAKLDVAKLRPGDVIHFIGVDENPAEPAIARLGDQPVWVWHMAMATGGGKFIVGDHFAGAVVELDLLAYLAQYKDFYQGVFVTRMEDGPRPAKCRRHAPMKKPVPR